MKFQQIRASHMSFHGSSGPPGIETDIAKSHATCHEHVGPQSSPPAKDEVGWGPWELSRPRWPAGQPTVPPPYIFDVEAPNWSLKSVWVGIASANQFGLEWWKLCKPKEKGGMGFRDMHSFYLAMLAKQVWRLLLELNSLHARVLRAKYYPDGRLLRAKAKTGSSFTW